MLASSQKPQIGAGWETHWSECPPLQNRRGVQRGEKPETSHCHRALKGPKEGKESPKEKVTFASLYLSQIRSGHIGDAIRRVLESADTVAKVEN